MKTNDRLNQAIEAVCESIRVDYNDDAYFASSGETETKGDYIIDVSMRDGRVEDIDVYVVGDYGECDIACFEEYNFARERIEQFVSELQDTAESIADTYNTLNSSWSYGW